MSTPLGLKRRRNREFEQLAGVESKYVRPWNPATNVHPIALSLPSYAEPIVPAIPGEAA